MTSPRNNRQAVGIAHPQATVESLQETVIALKEAVEMLMQQRGHSDNWAVTWGDLIRVGIVRPDQVPRAIPNRGVQ